MQSEALLTAGFTGSPEVFAGGTLRLVPNGDSSWARGGGRIGPPIKKAEGLEQGTGGVADVPTDMPPGQYTWRAIGYTGFVPLQRCEGVIACNVSVRFDEVGVVTVRR